MWRISAYDRDGREIAHFELGDGELTIGRDPDRQLVLPSASISRRHARILIQNGSPCIVDDGSSNGVLVNGVRISAATQVSGATRIDVAEFRIAVEPMMATASVPPLEPVRQYAPPSADAGGGAGLRLVAEGGPYDGRVFNLPPGLISVGRAVDNDLMFDDPSLSRKHARIHREAGRMEVEDLGSSNGTHVNGRKIGRAVAGSGDVVRFGDLSFRVEGGEYGSTRSVEPEMPRLQLYVLIGGGAATFIILVLAIVFLVRKIPPVQASGRDAIARISKQAEMHLKSGKQLYQEKKYADAKTELDQAVELDPANAEARRLRSLAAHGSDDDRAYTSATGSLAVGDRKGLEGALRLYGDITEGSQARTQLQGKLVPALSRFGAERCSARALPDCAWALCKAFELAPPESRPSAQLARTLRDVEKKLKKTPGFLPCRAAP